MSRFERIKFNRKDTKLLAKVRALAGTEWSTNHTAIKELRGRLLELQSWRCAYCQIGIEVDENGHREIDHILPKKASKNCSATNGASDSQTKRRHTLGYSAFTYEPKNLAIACKQCNTNKGTYDGRRHRSSAVAQYPKKADFEWVHPHLHQYFQNIRINQDLTFSKITDEGDAVIRACKLDQIVTLEKRYRLRAKAKAKQASTLQAAVMSLVAAVDSHNARAEDAVKALCEVWGLQPDEAKSLISQLVDAASTAASVEDMARAYGAMLSIANRLRNPARAAQNLKARSSRHSPAQ